MSKKRIILYLVITGIISFIVVVLIRSQAYKSKDELPKAFNSLETSYSKVSNSYFCTFNNAAVFIEFVEFNSQIDGTLYQFIINDNFEEKNYNIPLSGYIIENEIVINTEYKNYSGIIDKDCIYLNWDDFKSGNVENVCFKKASIDKYNNYVDELKADSLEDQKNIELNNKIMNIVDDISEDIESITYYLDELNKTKFDYTEINEALEGVKEAYNIYLNASPEDKEYEYSMIEYEISTVEYEYSVNKDLVDSLIKDINDIEDLKTSINESMKEYKKLSGENFEYKRLDDVLSESKTLKSNIENKYIEYLNYSKSILNKAYEYK